MDINTHCHKNKDHKNSFKKSYKSSFKKDHKSSFKKDHKDSPYNFLEQKKKQFLRFNIGDLSPDNPQEKPKKIDNEHEKISDDQRADFEQVLQNVDKNMTTTKEKGNSESGLVEPDFI